MYIYLKNTGLILSLCMAVIFSVASYGKEKNISWLDSQINKDPEVIAAKELLNASSHRAKGLTQAVYNPELEASYEKEGDFDNYSIGISQTIDFWDKQSANKSIGEIDVYVNQQQLLSLLDSKKANALTALVNWQAAKEAAQLLSEREEQLQTLVGIVEDKRKAGLLEPLDAELVYLNLSQIFSEISESQIALKNAEVKVQELLPDWTPNAANLFSFTFGATSYSFNSQWVEDHPKVKLAKAQWKGQQSKAQLTTMESKANPTIGISAGRSSDEDLVGLTFSIPLNIRNNYSDTVKAAYSEAIAAEANFRSVYRKQSFEAKANYESLLVSKKYYEQWRKLTKGRLDSSANLLIKRWEAGDINTSDYLLALNQRAEGLHAGIRLENQFKLAEISFVLSMGQLSKFEI
ncbi:MAG: TolC family protein [Colwellia sp.]|nr:TolC family protein [Colwellia sp.]